MLFGKPWEFWMAFLGAMVYTITRDAEQAPVKKRIGKVIASGALGFSLADDLVKIPFLSGILNGSESLSAVVIMIFGLMILDAVSLLLADPNTIKKVIQKKMGGGDDDKG